MRGSCAISAGRSLLVCLSLAATLAIAGCGTLSGDAVDLPTDCILQRTIRDFEALDDQNLIIHGPGSRAYHVVLVTPVNNLDREFAIGVLDAALGPVVPDGRICPYGGDAIIVEGPITERVPIRSIESLNDSQLESLRVEFGEEESGDDLVTTTVIE
jgi:hypothetical protein